MVAMHITLDTLMHTVIQIKSLPESIREKAIKNGRMQGPNRLEIDIAMLNNLLRSIPNEPERIRGLGDIVAIFAKPIAKIIDAVAGTKIANCGGCGRRQAKLNKTFPMKIKPLPEHRQSDKGK